MFLRNSINSLVCPSILFIFIHQLTDFGFSAQRPHSPPVSRKLRNGYVALSPELMSIHLGFAAPN
jgi:hypothetical protein